MFSFVPTPQSLEDGVIRFDKGRFAGAMAMIIGLAPNPRVELGYQMRRRHLLVSLHDFPDLTEERLDIRSGWLREKLTSIFADMVTQKIKAVLHVRNAGFLRGEFESAFVQDLLYQRFDFLFGGDFLIGLASNVHHAFHCLLHGLMGLVKHLSMVGYVLGLDRQSRVISFQ
jgi:hypothetical protein